jgi:heptosyltransferase-3
VTREARSALTFARPPRSVLVVVTRRIGDVLLATPVLRSIKARWPDAALDVLAFAGTEGLLAGHPDVNRVLTVPERPPLLEHLRFAGRLWRRYDLALSLVPGDRPTLYAWIAGKRRVGLLVADRKSRWKRSLLDRWVAFDNDDTHTVRMHLALLDAIGVSPHAAVRPSWTAEDEALADRLLAPLAGAPYAVLHPHPKFRYKMWTEQGWGAVGRWISAQGWGVVLTGGPGADEREYVKRIAADIPGAIDLSGRLSLGAVAAVLARAQAYAGPDTAVTHAAAALGIPTVALFGPSNPVKWGPWPAGHPVAENPWQRVGTQARAHVRLVQGAGACVPCGNEGCERHVNSTSDCLTGIEPARVIAALQEAIAACRTSNPARHSE